MKNFITKMTFDQRYFKYFVLRNFIQCSLNNKYKYNKETFSLKAPWQISERDRLFMKLLLFQIVTNKIEKCHFLADL